MKRKFIIFLTALITAACAILSGCSCAGCSGDEMLAFSNAFHGGSRPPANYNETLKYSVSYSADYLSSFKKDAELSKYFTFEYGVKLNALKMSGAGGNIVCVLYSF